MAAFRCQACGAEFPSQEALMQHSASMHPQAARQHFACQACGMEFHSQAELQAHNQAVHRM